MKMKKKRSKLFKRRRLLQELGEGERANNGNQNGANRRPPAQAQAQAQGPAPRRNATPEFDDDDDEIFASIDENDGEVFGVPRNSASGRDGNANGNRNNGWVGHEVIDLSSSP